MRVIKTSDLKKDMRFTMPVFMEDENVLVAAELPLKQRDIDRLSRWGITEVMTDGVIIEPNNKEESLWGFPSDREIRKVYIDIIEKTAVILAKVNKSEKVNIEEIDLLAAQIVKEMETRPFELKRMVLSENIKMDPLSMSSVNCAIIAVGISLNMNRARHKHIQLASGALLHDVGMFKVSKDIIDKKGLLSDKERQQIKTHPLYTYSIITKDLGYSEDIALIGLQHHERWDGEGYPRKLTGEGIVLDARIVSVADAFEAMVSVRPYRNSIIGYQAIRNIITDNSSRFDPNIVKIFIKSMGLYPVGSIVILSDGSIARVIYINGNAPLRPRIIQIISKDGEEFRDDSGPILDLLDEKELFIVKSVDLKAVIERNGK